MTTTKSTTAAKERTCMHASKQTNKQQHMQTSIEECPSRLCTLLVLKITHTLFFFFFLSTESNPFLRNLTLNELQVT